MKNFSAKNKIIILLAAWLIVSGGMFFYFFKLLDVANTSTLDSMAEDRKNLVVLRAKDKSFKQAQADLQELAAKPFQPEDFFSRDISLVKELQTLEDLGRKYNLKMQIAGVSGTIGTLSKAQTVTQLAVIPYGLTLNGNFYQAMQFLENYEHLNFITSVSAISLSAVEGNDVSMSLASNFYLRK